MVYLTYHKVKINIIIINVLNTSKYLDVVLKASIISAYLSSERDIIKSLS